MTPKQPKSRRKKEKFPVTAPKTGKFRAPPAPTPLIPSPPIRSPHAPPRPAIAPPAPPRPASSPASASRMAISPISSRSIFPRYGAGANVTRISPPPSRAAGAAPPSGWRTRCTAGRSASIAWSRRSLPRPGRRSRSWCAIASMCWPTSPPRCSGSATAGPKNGANSAGASPAGAVPRRRAAGNRIAARAGRAWQRPRRACPARRSVRRPARRPSQNCPPTLKVNSLVSSPACFSSALARSKRSGPKGEFQFTPMPIETRGLALLPE